MPQSIEERVTALEVTVGNIQSSLDKMERSVESVKTLLNRLLWLMAASGTGIGADLLLRLSG